MRPFTSILLVLAAALLPASAGALRLFEDLETTGEPLWWPLQISGPPIAFYGSNPSQLVQVADRLWFVADDRFHGAELWSTDGTADGTSLLLDFCPGTCSSNPEIVGILGSGVVLRGATPETGREIWWTDGTEEGTRLLADLCPGTCHGAPDLEFAWMNRFDDDASARIGEVLYFAARTPDLGREMWRTDGTAEGTRPVMDLCPGECDGIFNGFDLRAVGGRVVVAGDDGGSHGLEPWAFTDTSAEILIDSCPGPMGASNLWNMISSGDRVVFAADCEGVGSALFATDGTPEETVSLRELPDDREISAWLWDGTSLPDGRSVLSILYIGSSRLNELWVTDGTSEGTMTLSREIPDSFADLVPFDGGVALAGRDGMLWLTDGTLDGTRAFPLSATLSLAEAADGDLLLSVFGPDSTQELLRTDGTSDGTEYVGPLAPGPSVAPRLEAASIGDVVLLGGWQDPLEGSELWAIDRRTEPETGCPLDDPEALCLLDGRFEARVTWTDPRTESTGAGYSTSSTEATGHFWFFNQNNLEMTLKIIDATAINGAFWLFTGAVSDVGVEIEITDHETGTTREWLKGPGDLCGLADIGAFFENETDPTSPSTSPSKTPSFVSPLEGAPFSRESDPDAPAPLALQNGRFEVNVSWTDPRTGDSGYGVPLSVEGSEQTGFFWFFNESNLELLVKIIDGRPINGSWWLLWGGLTDLGLELEVNDLEAGTTQTFRRSSGSLCGEAIIDRFPESDSTETLDLDVARNAA